MSPHRTVPSPLFGTIYRPRVEVEFQTRGRAAWLSVPMIVDTGADYTILPRWLASDLGIDLRKDCEKHTTVGVGGVETVFLARQVTVRLGRWVGHVPVGFLNHDNVPPLLGRQEFSEEFRLIFENHTTTFIVPRPRKTHAR